MAKDVDEERRARVTRLIERYETTKQREQMERAMKIWRRAETNQRLANLLKAPPTKLN